MNQEKSVKSVVYEFIEDFADADERLAGTIKNSLEKRGRKDNVVN